MSFTVTQVGVAGFRNYDKFEIELDAGLTVLVGPNAVGKTNLIEAVELLTEADSFRNPVWADVVRWGSNDARLWLDAADGERRYRVDLSINASGRRSYRVNGKARRSVSDVSGIIPCVVFTPEDLRVVKESAERRRAALDSIGTQLSRTYGQLKTEYDRVVRQRNALFRTEAVEQETLEPWDERLVALGSKLVAHRRGLFDRVIAHAAVTYADIAEDGPLTARYLPCWERDGVGEADADPAAALEAHLAAKRHEEMARRTTLVGPHRDEIVFAIDGRDARVFASQGQQRTVALAFKLAEVAVVGEVAQARPILLLDDVMSELDEVRRHALADLVGKAAQTIVTTTHLGYFSDDLVERAKVVNLG